jgi:hypothetical protein|tara:strand:+ start:1681 stop:1911 length:231 start_codon:yes stop_codon:yes gene_type:complete
MDELDALIEKFNRKMETHPELSSVWINYITLKKMRLRDIIQHGEHTLQMLETTDDIPIHSIALLYLMEKYTNDSIA